MDEIKDTRLLSCDSKLLAEFVAEVLIEKKAHDVTIYCVKEDSSITDYYVNATGFSARQAAALADEVAYKTGLSGRDPLRVEGRGANNWLLVDYGDVIVNVFDKPSREFYNFDRLLPEEGKIDISDVVKRVDEKLGFNNKEE